MIEKLKPEGKYWLDEGGRTHPDRASYLAGIFGLCGCGDSRGILNHIKEILIKCYKQDWDYFKYEDFPTMFMLSYLDHGKYIEHGVTIRCSWLTDKGEEAVKDLEIALSEPEVNFGDKE